MDKDRLNNMVVDLFHGISYEEEKAVITDEFKDISNKDLHIIDAIGIKKPKNMSTIAGDLNITVGTLTTAINNLLKKGYVNRKRGEKDRRVVYISLSVPCARRLREALVQARAIPNVARPKATNGTGYWTRTTDISKTGAGCLRGDKILRTLRNRAVRFADTIRLAAGTIALLRPPIRVSASALSLKS